MTKNFSILMLSFGDVYKTLLSLNLIKGKESFTINLILLELIISPLFIEIKDSSNKFMQFFKVKRVDFFYFSNE
jgi:hypothetical protein